jgi:hypothetical protein
VLGLTIDYIAKTLGFAQRITGKHSGVREQVNGGSLRYPCPYKNFVDIEITVFARLGW